MNERYFDNGAVRLNYGEIPSSGTPLVLLHGGNARRQAFESIVPELAARWHVLAPDLRGHGRSGRTPGHYRLQDYADDTISLLQQVVGEPAYLFGHSLGGIVALLVAARCPACVRAVVVGDAPLSRHTWQKTLSSSQDRLAAWRNLSGGQVPLDAVIESLKDTPIEAPGRAGTVPLREAMGEASPVFAWLATNLYQSDPDLLTALLERFDTTAAGYEMDLVLPKIQCPVLLLQADPGAGGVMTDAEISEALPLLARPQHVRLPGVSHVLHNERKEPVLSALTAFYQSC